MYKPYNFSVSMDWAVGCHLGRDKTIEKVVFWAKYQRRDQKVCSAPRAVSKK